MTNRDQDLPVDQASGVQGGWAQLIGDTDRFASEWERIETGFVDDPRRAVEEADRLVAEVTQVLVDSFSDTRARLEKQWGKGTEVGTEDLRLTLRRYRAFLDLLLRA